MHPLDARLEVVRGSWKGLRNPFPVRVQAESALECPNSRSVG